MSKFETEFLDSHLKLGLASMPKTDIVRQGGTGSFQGRPRESKTIEDGRRTREDVHDGGNEIRRRNGQGGRCVGAGDRQGTARSDLSRERPDQGPEHEVAHDHPSGVE